MTRYRKLLYNIGGGIISDAQRSEQNGSAAIIIGLGGTGKDAIKHLKKEIYQRIAPDNDGEAAARYRQIRYLCIDTDANDLQNNYELFGIDPISEFFSIQGDVGIFTNEAQASILANQPYARWLNYRTMWLQSTHSASAVRQIGRYFMLQKSVSFILKLQQILASAVRDMDPYNPHSRNVNIHIMTGLCGGTGSGIFLDTCYLIRKAVETCTELTGKCVRICGYFFMPDVNLSRISQDSVRSYIMANSYAAMKELDYCMSFSENGGKWQQQYDGFAIETQKPPVDVAYLVSAQTADDRFIFNEYEYAMRVVSDYVVQFISDSSINMDTHICGFSSLEAMLPKPHGGNYKYVIIGASHSIVPMREAATYLASKLFEKMAAAWSTEPTDQDIEEFCKRIGLTLENLIRDTGTFTIRIPDIVNDFDCIPTDDAGDKYTYGYVLPERILAPFRAQQYRIFGEILKKGQEGLVNEWEYGMALDEFPSSIVCRVFKALDEIVRDPRRGPFYAAKILFGSDKKNLIYIITGFAETVKIHMDEARGYIDLGVRDVKMARAAYNDRPGIDLFRRYRTSLFEALLIAVRKDIERRCIYEQYRLLYEALNTAKKQLLDLYSDYFSKYADVIGDLQKVFEENRLTITELQDVSADPFMLPLFKISEVRNTLNEEVNKLNIDTAIDFFNSAFYMGAYEIWHNGNEDEIASWFNRYMSKVYQQQINLSPDDLLCIRYPDLADYSNVPLLAEKAREDIIQKLDDMAAELFLLDGAKALRVQSHADTLTYCSAPDTAPIVNKAINDYRVSKPGITHVSGSKDRISFLRYTPGVPMFAYRLMDECYQSYINAQNWCGMHLYEGAPGNGDPRNWQTLLPNLRPYSIYEHIDWTTEGKKAIADGYRTAEQEFGIVHPEVDEYGYEYDTYYIWRTPDYMPQIKAAIQLLDSAQSLLNMTDNPTEQSEQLHAMLPLLIAEQNQLKNCTENLTDHKLVYTHDAVNGTFQLIKPEIPPIRIRNDGDKSTAATAFAVRRDNVLASPVFTSYVMEELNKATACKEVMERFDSVIGQIQAKLDSLTEMTGQPEAGTSDC